MIADRIERQLLALEDRFGLNPAERQRLYAQRAQTGVTGDLFAAEAAKASTPAPAASPLDDDEPIGFLQ